jgi:hypothetical protein
MILTPDQLVELTGHKRSDAQRRDGSLVVLSTDVATLGTIVPKMGTPEPELYGRAPALTLFVRRSYTKSLHPHV